MSWNTTEDTLKSLFASSGNVKSVRIIRNYNGNSKGFGYVEFDSTANVTAALKLNGKDVDGRELKLDVST
jgi:nucleolin